MYNGKEICQGCRKSGTEKSREAKYSLCPDCAKMLKLGKAKEVELKHDYTYIRQFMFALRDIEIDGYAKIDLNSTLCNLIKSLNNSNAERSETIIGLIGQYYDNSYSAIIPSDIIEPIKHLFLSMQDIVIRMKKEKEDLPKLAKEQVDMERDRIFNEGVEIGKSLLFQLNSGGLSLHDFDKKLNYK